MQAPQLEVHIGPYDRVSQQALTQTPSLGFRVEDLESRSSSVGVVVVVVVGGGGTPPSRHYRFS